eukprot:4971672-Lingulodinium_polyedra.AAC.1
MAPLGERSPPNLPNRRSVRRQNPLVAGGEANLPEAGSPERIMAPRGRLRPPLVANKREEPTANCKRLRSTGAARSLG